MESTITWLQEWYRAQCDGRWEHDHGISIESLDNPGWRLRVDLEGTRPTATYPNRVLLVAGDPPGPHNGNIGSAEWMSCEVRSMVFIGAGDALALEAIVRCLKNLVGAGARSESPSR